jgi:hypothetical protein
MRAYDIEVLKTPVDRASPDNQGWVFGLPPGIGPEQWPLDPASGYPLQHGFTLLLPEDYRCHGPDIVAFSFFAKACDHGAYEDPAMVAAAPPEDHRYLPFWRSAAHLHRGLPQDAEEHPHRGLPQDAEERLHRGLPQDPEKRLHPRLHRLTDSLDQHYAVILLTRAEFDGPWAEPPDIPRVGLEIDSRRHKVAGRPRADGTMEWDYAPDMPRPLWLDRGGMRGYFDFTCSPTPDFPIERFGLYKNFGGAPGGKPRHPLARARAGPQRRNCALRHMAQRI